MLFHKEAKRRIRPLTMRCILFEQGLIRPYNGVNRRNISDRSFL